MMKLIIIIFTALPIQIIAQNLQVEYTYYASSHIDTKAPARLLIDNTSNRSLYIIDVSKTESTSKENNLQLINSLKSRDSIVNFYDGNNHTQYSFSRIGAEQVEIVDKLPKINWLITSESKKVIDLNCTKATTTFRGRKWTAWFTTDFPTNIGPYKFHGLPGIIIELTDERNSFQFVANKIIKVSHNFAQDFANFNQFQKKLNNPLSLQDVEEARSLYAEAFVNDMNQRGDQLKVLKNERKTIERIYEWEEQVTK